MDDGDESKGGSYFVLQFATMDLLTCFAVCADNTPLTESPVIVTAVTNSKKLCFFIIIIVVSLSSSRSFLAEENHAY